MSLTSVGKNGRVYRRKFDHEDALRRYAAGESASELAREYGVTTGAVQQVVSPTIRQAAAIRYQRYRLAGRCVECGGIKSLQSYYVSGSELCVSCATQKRATSVRDDALRCQTCREWKSDDEFPSNRSEKGLRRGRHTQCRRCLTVARQAYRERRKVPCVVCGKPALPPSEKKTGGSSFARCRPCFLDWQREERRKQAAGRFVRFVQPSAGNGGQPAEGKAA